MRKRVLAVEWYMIENDAEWEEQCALLLPDNERAANRHRPLHRYGWSVAALLLLVSSGGWWWHTGQTGSQQAEAELRTTAQPELKVVASSDNPFPAHVTDDQTPLAWQPQFGPQDTGLQGVQSADCDTQIDRSLRTVEFQGDQAVAHVITYTEAGTPAYRQTYFYRCTARGWLRTAAPDIALWGSAHSLETPSFIFHFQQNDAPAVIAVAAQVDRLYTSLRQNFGLPTGLGGGKLVVDISVTQPPGALPWFGAPAPIRVPSPALYIAPVELTDAELLAQAIALPLIKQVLTQASEHSAIGKSWQPMLHGLYLWQVWDLDLPLSVWREAVVTWVYTDLPTMRPGQAVVLPARYTAICAAHKLWLSSPLLINIPLMCVELAWEDFLLPPWGWYEPLTHLNQLSVPLRPGEYLEEPDSLRLTRHPGHTVGLATLLEYAVATYGREHLPALLAGLGQYESWETLLPAVYGVSASEFEAGWQQYLVAHYGL